MDIRNLLSKGRSRSISPEQHSGSDKGDQAHKGQSSTGKEKGKWSAERHSQIREPGAGPYSSIRDTSPTQQIDNPKGKRPAEADPPTDNPNAPRKKARMESEGSQEQEKDDTSLILDNIQIDTLKRLKEAINSFSKGNSSRTLFPIGHPYHETALSLYRETTKVIQFREKRKNASREDAYTAMNQLLTEIPKVPTASTKVTGFLHEVEQIKQNNSEQVEEDPSGS